MKKVNRKEHEMHKAAMLIETKKQVMHFKLRIKNELDLPDKEKVVARRERRKM